MCDKAFIYASYLKEHMKKHSDVHEFQCGKCNKQFKHKSLCNRHKKGCGLKEDAYKCPFENCSFSSNELHVVNDHKRTYHRETNAFSCEKCGKTFKYHDGKKRHKCPNN